MLHQRRPKSKIPKTKVMEDTSLPSNGLVQPGGAPSSLDDADANVPVSRYSIAQKNYPLETLEVHGQDSGAAGSYAPTLRSVPFSRRRATIVSLFITVLVLILTGITAALFVERDQTRNKSLQSTVPVQDVSLENAADASLPRELQGAEESLLVNGDIITRGDLKVVSNSFVTLLATQELTADQAINLPNASGTICLDANNCNFATQNQLNQQGTINNQQTVQITQLETQLGQIVIPPAGVTSLNDQNGAVSIQGSLNRVSITTANGTITLSTPQDLDANANVQFGNLSLAASGALTANTLQQTGAGNDISIDADSDEVIFTSDGRIFHLPTSGAGTQTICTTTVGCGGGGGAGVDDVNGLSGSVTLQGTANQVTVSTGLGTITFSTPQNINTTSSPTFAGLTLTAPLGVGSGGTGLAATPTNGQLLIGNGVGYSLSTLANGGGLAITNGAGTISIAVNYGSGANTAVQGNTILTCASGAGNLTGGGNGVTLGAGGSCSNIGIVNNPTFSTSVTTPSLVLTGAGSNGTLQVASLGQTTAYTLPDPGQATADICLSTGNCVGGAGGAPNNAAYLTVGNNATLSGERAIAVNATNLNFTDGGANGSYTINTAQNIATTSTPSFAGLTLTGNLSLGTNTIQGTTAAIDFTNFDVSSTGDVAIHGGDLTIGAAAQAGTLLLHDGDGETITLALPDISTSYALTLPTAVGSANQCLKAQNGTGALFWDTCTGGAGGGLSGSGTLNRVAKFTPDGTTIGDSSLSDNGSTVTANGNVNLAVQGTTITVGVGSTRTGSVVLNNSTNNNNVTIQSGVTGASYALTLPTAVGAADQCLKAQDGVGTLVWDDCLGGGGGGGITSIDGQTGPAVAVSNATGAGNVITIDNAVADGTTKGIAAFNGTNFSAASGVINTIQGISTAAAPQFAGLTLTGNLDMAANTITGTTAVIDFTNFDVLGNGNTTIGGILGVSGASVTIGTASASNGSLVLKNATNALTVTLNAPNQATGSTTISFPNTGADTSDTVCLQDVNNCAGTPQNTFNTINAPNGTDPVADSATDTLNLTDGTNIIITGTVGSDTIDIATVANPTFATSVTTPTLQSSGALSIASGGGGDITIDGADELIVQDAAVFNGQASFNTDVDVVLGDSENLSIGSTITGTTAVSVLNMVVTNNTSSGTQNLALLQNAAGSGITDGLLVLDNADTDTAVGGGIVITSAAGGITNGIDVSDSDIGNALLFGANDVIGTNFTIAGASGAVTLGAAAQQGSLVLHDGNGETATVSVGSALAANTALAIPTTVGASDTFCLLILANCPGTGDAVSVNSAAATNANFLNTAASGTEAAVAWSLNTVSNPDDVTVSIGNASATVAGTVTTGSQTFAGVKTFNGQIVAGAGINLGTQTLQGTTAVIDFTDFDVASTGSVTIGSQKTITLVGGTTAQRPGSPSEGMVYFDSTTDRLLTYMNGKWQGDRTTATKIVAASNSSQTDKDAADYVADGTGDQTEINAALTAGAGGFVYLMPGTYVTSADISVPNNTTLAGAGRGTRIELADVAGATVHMITNTDQGGSGTGVTVRDMQLNGRKDLNDPGGDQTGVFFLDLGGDAGSTARQGGKVTGLWISSFRGEGIFLNGSENNTISNNVLQDNLTGIRLYGVSSNNLLTTNNAQGNATFGFYVQLTSTNNNLTGNISQGNGDDGFNLHENASNNTLTGNTAQGNTGDGFEVRDGDSSVGSTLTGNTAQGNTQYGINIFGSDTNEASQVVTGNSIKDNAQGGINVYNSHDNTISGNKVHDNGGATTNNGIRLEAADNNTVSGNNVTDSSCSTTCYALNISSSTSNNNYLGGNTIDAGTINDVGTGTIYGGQLDNNGDYKVGGTDLFIEKKLILGVDARTIADNGGGTNATLSLSPISAYVEITCNDTQACDVTMNETGLAQGQTLTLVNIAGSNTVVNINEAAGVVELAGNWASNSLYDSLSLIYAGANGTTGRWVELSRSDN